MKRKEEMSKFGIIFFVHVKTPITLEVLFRASNFAPNNFLSNTVVIQTCPDKQTGENIPSTPIFD